MRRERPLLYLAAWLAASSGYACQSAQPDAPVPPTLTLRTSSPVAPAATALPAPPPTAATPTAAEAPTAASSASAPPKGAPVPPYPDTWREEAEADPNNASLRCLELVYKRGCSELRTGKVTVEVTLGPDGQVSRVTSIENAIRREPEVVWKCLRSKLPRWKFRPPQGVSPTFQMTFIFSDKC